MFCFEAHTLCKFQRPQHLRFTSARTTLEMKTLGFKLTWSIATAAIAAKLIFASATTATSKNYFRHHFPTHNCSSYKLPPAATTPVTITAKAAVTATLRLRTVHYATQARKWINETQSSANHLILRPHNPESDWKNKMPRQLTYPKATPCQHTLHHLTPFFPTIKQPNLCSPMLSSPMLPHPTPLYSTPT